MFISLLSNYLSVTTVFCNSREKIDGVAKTEHLFYISAAPPRNRFKHGYKQDSDG
jgi:hypothetical protein